MCQCTTYGTTSSTLSIKPSLQVRKVKHEHIAYILASQTMDIRFTVIISEKLN